METGRTAAQARATANPGGWARPVKTIGTPVPPDTRVMLATGARRARRAQDTASQRTARSQSAAGTAPAMGMDLLTALASAIARLDSRGKHAASPLAMGG